MLSYQHIYHAGHMADVVKHTVLAGLLVRLTHKEVPLSYLETHGGRGLYPVDAPEMQKTAEWRMGIARLWPRRGEAGMPVAVARYLEAVAHYNRGIGLVQVPGSPALAQHLLRAEDKIICCEAHPQEAQALRQVLQADQRADLYQGNGHVVIPTLLPPTTGRGLVLIDPSYEEKGEYQTVVATVDDMYGIWSKGVVAVWYPLLAAGRHTEMLDGLKSLDIPATWVGEVAWASEGDAYGMRGCGLAVLRLPYELEKELEPALGWLAEQFNGKAVTHWLQKPR